MAKIEATKREQPVLDLTPETEVQKPQQEYVKPSVLSHSGEDILDELGPAQACYPFNSCGVTP